MSYFKDLLVFNSNYQINGVTIPEPTSLEILDINNISDGGRPADTLDYIGSFKGWKCSIKLKYAQMNKEHFDLLFNLTQGRYINNQGFFMSIKIPTYTPLGVYTFTGYFMSKFSVNCKMTTEMLEDVDSSYQYGGANYDEFHQNVEFSFVQQ